MILGRDAEVVSRKIDLLIVGVDTANNMQLRPSVRERARSSARRKSLPPRPPPPASEQRALRASPASPAQRRRSSCSASTASLASLFLEYDSTVGGVGRRGRRGVFLHATNLPLFFCVRASMLPFSIKFYTKRRNFLD